jgi:hypothetical protein
VQRRWLTGFDKPAKRFKVRPAAADIRRIVIGVGYLVELFWIAGGFIKLVAEFERYDFVDATVDEQLWAFYVADLGDRIHLCPEQDARIERQNYRSHVSRRREARLHDQPGGFYSFGLKLVREIDGEYAAQGFAEEDYALGRELAFLVSPRFGRSRDNR